MPQDQYARVHGVRLHYLDWGGQGPLLLLVPGLSHTAHTYAAMAPALAGGFRVVAVTRREHGPSSKQTGPLTLDGLADDLAGFLRLFSDEPAIIAGQSFAGLEMPRVAARYPERVKALIFLDAVYDWPGILARDQPPFPEGYGFEDTYASMAELETWFAATYPELWGAPARTHLRSQTYLEEEGRVAWELPISSPVFGAFFNLAGAWTAEEYRGLEVPILSIQAGFEGFFEANLSARGAPESILVSARTWARDLDAPLKRRGREMLAAAVPGAIMLHFEATHHWLHLHRPDRVVRVMKEFLEGKLLR